MQVEATGFEKLCRYGCDLASARNCASTPNWPWEPCSNRCRSQAILFRAIETDIADHQWDFHDRRRRQSSRQFPRELFRHERLRRSSMRIAGGTGGRIRHFAAGRTALSNGRDGRWCDNQEFDGGNFIGDAFPSTESISEIRADGVLANAEFGNPGQIVVTTKGGSNTLHGTAFWYYQDFRSSTRLHTPIRPPRPSPACTGRHLWRAAWVARSVFPHLF